jgi:hypothetical protein
MTEPMAPGPHDQHAAAPLSRRPRPVPPRPGRPSANHCRPGSRHSPSAEPGRDQHRQEHCRRVPAPLMTTIAELGTFLARGKAAAGPAPLAASGSKPITAMANGAAVGAAAGPG